MEESKDVNMVARAKHNSGKFKAMMVAVCSSLTDRNPASATPIRPPARVHLGNGICGGKYAVGMCGGIPGRRVKRSEISVHFLHLRCLHPPAIPL